MFLFRLLCLTVEIFYSLVPMPQTQNNPSLQRSANSVKRLPDGETPPGIYQPL
jgi:hypothetical protein